MTLRPPSPSIFRPNNAPSQEILREHRRLIHDIDRRNVLCGALSLGALTFLTGCNVMQDTMSEVDWPSMPWAVSAPAPQRQSMLIAAASRRPDVPPVIPEARA